MPEQAASLVVDQFIDRFNLALSLSLGLYEASDVAKSVHYLRYLCAFAVAVSATFYAQWYISRVSAHYGRLFLLFWRIAERVVAFAQSFLITISFNIAIQKLRENSSESDTVGIVSRFMLYTVVFVLLTTTTALWAWYFYEQPLPQDEFSTRIARELRRQKAQ